jgi:(1->4)-alpha-D-glucan 1-alpha-D-glucosylmutase
MIVVAVPRFLTRIISGGGSVPFGRAVWEDTRLVLPEIEVGKQFKNIFTSEVVAAGLVGDRQGINLSDVFASFPVAVLEKVS